MLVSVLLAFFAAVNACSDFYMNFTDPTIKLSVRTMDLGLMKNWTITAWPANRKFFNLNVMDWDPKYSTVGISANWFGDDRWGAPSFFGDSLNEHGLSCSLLTLVDTQYESRDDSKINVFAGVLCHWATQMFQNVAEVNEMLPKVAIWGPDALAQHFVLRDATGASLVIECVGGAKQVYLDLNDGVSGFGIMTNEPQFSYHLENVKHYEWKRTLARQAVAIPGNYYPEERFLRIHMIKQGMQSFMESTTDIQTAISLAVQVMNTVTVPMGEQYGTDSGESSGEGDGDHSVFGLVRDHYNKVLYWRDATNPTLRGIRLADVLGRERKLSMTLESGPYFVDMSKAMLA